MGYQLHINPSGSPKGILQRHPHPPTLPTLPPTPASSSLTKSHFLCLSNRYWLKITRTSHQVLIFPQEHIQDPCMKNLSTWRRHEDSLQQCVADQTPPTDVQRRAVYSATRGRPDGGKNYNRKIPLPTRDERSQLTSRTGRTTQELSRDFFADPMKTFTILIPIVYLICMSAAPKMNG